MLKWLAAAVAIGLGLLIGSAMDAPAMGASSARYMDISFTQENLASWVAAVGVGVAAVALVFVGLLMWGCRSWPWVRWVSLGVAVTAFLWFWGQIL